MTATADLIDADRLRTLIPGVRVEYHASLRSTQDLAHQLAADPATKLPLLVVAEEQTAGRGRGTNRWWTGGGSLAMTLVVNPTQWESGPQVLPQRSVAVAVAIVDAIAASVLASEQFALDGLGIHWPNDVFVDGRKVAGILVDVLAGGAHIIGVGLNVNNSLQGAPEEVQSRATTLFELTGRKFDRTEVLATLVQELDQALRSCGEAPEAFGQRFDSLCLQRGSELTIESAGKTTQGMCVGIDHDGALLLQTRAGEQRFYSGVLRH